MKHEQIKIAIEKIELAFTLLNDARILFEQNEIELCGISPKWSYPHVDEIQIYSGIRNLADACKKEATVDEKLNTKDMVVMVGDTRFFEIIQSDGTYR